MQPFVRLRTRQANLLECEAVWNLDRVACHGLPKVGKAAIGVQACQLTLFAETVGERCVFNDSERTPGLHAGNPNTCLGCQQEQVSVTAYRTGGPDSAQ